MEGKGREGVPPNKYLPLHHWWWLVIVAYFFGPPCIVSMLALPSPGSWISHFGWAIRRNVVEIFCPANVLSATFLWGIVVAPYAIFRRPLSLSPLFLRLYHLSAENLLRTIFCSCIFHRYYLRLPFFLTANLKTQFFSHYTPRLGLTVLMRRDVVLSARIIASHVSHLLLTCTESKTSPPPASSKCDKHKNSWRTSAWGERLEMGGTHGSKPGRRRKKATRLTYVKERCCLQLEPCQQLPQQLLVVGLIHVYRPGIRLDGAGARGASGSGVIVGLGPINGDDNVKRATRAVVKRGQWIRLTSERQT